MTEQRPEQTPLTMGVPAPPPRVEFGQDSLAKLAEEAKIHARVPCGECRRKDAEVAALKLRIATDTDELEVVKHRLMVAEMSNGTRTPVTGEATIARLQRQDGQHRLAIEANDRRIAQLVAYIRGLNHAVPEEPPTPVYTDYEE